jgi:hypothetical protein
VTQFQNQPRTTSLTIDNNDQKFPLTLSTEIKVMKKNKKFSMASEGAAFPSNQHSLIT